MSRILARGLQCGTDRKNRPYTCSRPSLRTCTVKSRTISQRTGRLNYTTLTATVLLRAPALGVFDDSLAENRTIGALGKTTSGKRLRIRTYPKFDSLEEERLYRKQHLAAAFRIFADRGFNEGVAGHISVRDPILTSLLYAQGSLFCSVERKASS